MRVYITFKENDPLDNGIDSVWFYKEGAESRSREMLYQGTGEIYIEEYEILDVPINVDRECGFN